MTLRYSKIRLYPAIIKSFATLTMILSVNLAYTADKQHKVEHKPVQPSPNQISHKVKEHTEPKHHYKEISEAELQKIIDSLPDQDKTAITKIKEKIAGWPDEIFAEVRNYNEFLIEANRQAHKRYNKLSPAAREALTTERELKKSLSPDAVTILSDIHVDGH